MEETVRQRLWLTDRKAAISRQSDTAQMKAFPRRVIIGILWHGRLLGSRVSQTSGVLRPLNSGFMQGAAVVSCCTQAAYRLVIEQKTFDI